MIITFIFPDWVDPESTIEHDKRGFGIGHFNFAIATLSAVLKEAGHETRLIHVCYEPHEKQFKQELRDKHADVDIFAFSFSEVDVRWVTNMTRWIKEELGALTMGGGIYPILCPRESLETVGLDVVCLGEGERPMVEMCERMADRAGFEGIPNIWFRQDGGIVKNEKRWYVKDVDALPPYDFDLFPPERLKNLVSNLPRAYYLCTRNCAFGCAFCANHAKRKSLMCGSDYVRRFSPKRVISDIKLFREKYPHIKVIHFADEVIHFDKQWFRELMNLYVREIGLPWRSYAMLKILDEETADIMQWSNCTRVNVGIEAGSARIRKIYNRPAITEEEILAKLKLLTDRGIEVHSSTLLNAPTETMDEMLQTIKLVARSGTEIAVTGIVVPYEGTKLRKMAKQLGLYDSVAFENTGVSIIPTGCSKEKVLFFFHAYRLLVETYKLLYRNDLAARTLIPVVDCVVKSPFLPHRLLISIRERYFKGKLLNRAYRRAETKLGRTELSVFEAINIQSDGKSPGTFTPRADG